MSLKANLLSCNVCSGSDQSLEVRENEEIQIKQLKTIKMSTVVCNKVIISLLIIILSKTTVDIFMGFNCFICVFLHFFKLLSVGYCPWFRLRAPVVS